MRSTIKRVALCTTVAAVLVLAFSARAGAQDVFFALGYYANANTVGAPDGTLRLINDGFRGDSSPNGDLCAAIYVYDDQENQQECCSCRITPNGYLALSINSNLTANNPPHKALHRGVIKLVSSQPTSAFTCVGVTSVCDATTATINNNANTHIGIRAWLTHIEKVGSAYQTSTEDLKDSTLDTNATSPNAEAVKLAADCKALRTAGNGVTGVCSCAAQGR
jgi:hypothetical protein